MTERVFRYVPHQRINEYAAVGWVHEPGLEDTHHGHYAVLMRWAGKGEPIEPAKESANGYSEGIKK